MIIVINAGGSGTRLWPLSTPEYPKHLLQLTGERTLLQQSYDRATAIANTIYVATEAGHAQHVKEQLPELPESAFIIEPGRRGTAHCIVLALETIARRHNRDEPIAFLHSDHHIRDMEGFARSFLTAAKTSQQQSQIILIGVEPTFPATGFGYIERDGSIDTANGVFKVESFKEKPDFETAQRYVNSGKYFWNCGYFVGSVNTFLREMEENAPQLKQGFDGLRAIEDPDSEEFKEAYLKLDNQVIDIALIEKVKRLAVVAAGFDWMDVGSFKDLYEAVPKDENGNYFKGNAYPVDVENVYVRNEEDKPVAVIGLDNVIVVNTPAGILVARKDMSQRVGEIAKKLQA